MNKKTIRLILNLLIVVLACVLVFAVVQLVGYWREYHANSETQKQVQQLFYGETNEQQVSAVQSESSQAAESSSLDPVIAANPDTVGWIRIPDTVIDYAVVQGEDNDEYLHMGFYGEENAAGTIFMDYQNQMGEPLQNWIIYGHRMKDGSMFDGLGAYLDYAFYQQHPSFTFITQDGTYECQIFAVYQCTTQTHYCVPSFASEEAMLNYVQTCRIRSAYETGVEVTGKDTLITLSTCDYALDDDTGRLVVQAKLVLQEEGSESAAA